MRIHDGNVLRWPPNDQVNSYTNQSTHEEFRIHTFVVNKNIFKYAYWFY